MSEISAIAALNFFSELEDPRQAAKVMYPLPEIILVSLCASICGADCFVEFVEFGKAKLDFLRKLLPFKNGIPSHDTFGEVFASIDRKKFAEIFIKWVESLQSRVPGLVAIDGKTVRRSKNGEIPPIHMVSAWASEQNLALGQVKTDIKSNEIKAIPELLEMLVLKNALVSIDAMGCQKEIAAKIVSKRADYLLAVKDNQITLKNELELVFDAYDAGMAPMRVYESETLDKGHGRIEKRICSVIWEVENLEAAKVWPKLKCVGRIQAIREEKGRTSQECRYFICSRTLEAEEFAKAVRAHWGIENNLHWILDMIFREDENRARVRNAAANLVTMRHITLNLLNKSPGRQSMRVKRKRAGWDAEFLLAILQTPIAG